MSKIGSAAKVKLNSFDDLFGTDQPQAGTEQVQEIALSELHEFKGHPFKVLDDEKMQETIESVREHGVLMPGIARPRAEGGYEIIAGHRRRHACELVGLETMPMFIRDYTDDEATIIMMDSNIQREDILPSEKAKAYRMKYDAMKHQGSRTGGLTLEELGENAGESAKTVQRYIWISRLSEPLLDMVDLGKIGILQSVAMSGYLPFSAALPIVMGIGVGAACPVLMSGMSSNKNGKRTALVYLFNDLAGMIICGTLFYAIQAVVTRGGQFAFMDLEMKSVSIALLNTIYRTVTIIILAPFIKQINKLMFWIIKDSPDDVEDQADFDLLEERFLRNPELALTQVGTVMNGMARKAQKNVVYTVVMMKYSKK